MIFGFVGGITLSMIGFVFGLMVGMNIGGNYFPNFVFMSGQGYEATGYLGALIGAVIGFLIGGFIGFKLLSNVKKEDS